MLGFYELNMNNQKQYLEAIIPSALKQHTLIRLSNLLRLPLGFARKRNKLTVWVGFSFAFSLVFSRYFRGLIKSRLFCLHFLDLSASFGAHTGKKIILRKFALEQICETSRSFFRSCPVCWELGGCRGVGSDDEVTLSKGFTKIWRLHNWNGWRGSLASKFMILGLMKGESLLANEPQATIIKNFRNRRKVQRQSYLQFHWSFLRNYWIICTRTRMGFARVSRVDSEKFSSCPTQILCEFM